MVSTYKENRRHVTSCERLSKPRPATNSNSSQLSLTYIMPLIQSKEHYVPRFSLPLMFQRSRIHYYQGWFCFIFVLLFEGKVERGKNLAIARTPWLKKVKIYNHHNSLLHILSETLNFPTIERNIKGEFYFEIRI